MTFILVRFLIYLLSLLLPRPYLRTPCPRNFPTRLSLESTLKDSSLVGLPSFSWSSPTKAPLKSLHYQSSSPVIIVYDLSVVLSVPPTFDPLLCLLSFQTSPPLPPLSMSLSSPGDTLSLPIRIRLLFNKKSQNLCLKRTRLTFKTRVVSYNRKT